MTVERSASNSDSVAVVFEGAFADNIEELRERLPGLRTYLQVDDGQLVADESLGLGVGPNTLASFDGSSWTSHGSGGPSARSLACSAFDRARVVRDLVIGTDAAVRKAAQALVAEIRHALGSFPALPLNAEVAPRSVLTGWIAGDPLPDGLSLGEECELKDPAEHGAVVKCQRQELQSDEISKHLESGKQVTRLALTLDDHVSFVLGEDLVVRKFKLLDGAVDQLESTEREDVRAELDARFALMAAEFARLFTVLEKALKLSKADA